MLSLAVVLCASEAPTAVKASAFGASTTAPGVGVGDAVGDGDGDGVGEPIARFCSCAGATVIPP